MSNDELKITDSLLTKIRGAILGWKQGEALERNTKPVTREETAGLGYYNVHANLACQDIKMLETIINSLAGIKENEKLHNVMTRFAMDIEIGSGSRQAKRLEKSLETIGQIGQVIEMPQRNRPTPIAVDFND